MLKKSFINQSTLIASNLLEKLIHPNWIREAVLNLQLNRLEKGSLTLNLLGQNHRFDGKYEGRHAELTINQPLRCYWLLRTQGELGFAQAYIEEVVETPSLIQLMHLIYENQSALHTLLNKTPMGFMHHWRHRRRHNSLKNSRKNISFHYDLGNDFYSLWLDNSMTYSSAIFTDSTDSLQDAQKQKYQRLIQQIDAKPNQKIIEIGCGWGGFMEMALASGCHVKGLTLSEEQAQYAKTRCAKLGFVETENFEQIALDCAEKNAHFEVALQDYRQETGQYDAIVSIEMFEAVGKEYWHDYFALLKKSLKPHGKAALQVITIKEEFAEQYQSTVDFIQTYIFPGGLLPSIEQLHKLCEAFGFEVENTYAFGEDYATTCEHWQQSFNQQSVALLRLGYGHHFQRLWNYYLDYCIVGFKTGHISVHQVTLVHKSSHANQEIFA